MLLFITDWIASAVPCLRDLESSAFRYFFGASETTYTPVTEVVYPSAPGGFFYKIGTKVTRKQFAYKSYDPITNTDTEVTVWNGGFDFSFMEAVWGTKLDTLGRQRFVEKIPDLRQNLYHVRRGKGLLMVVGLKVFRDFSSIV
mgnify:CR=1 FL=1